MVVSMKDKKNLVMVSGILSLLLMPLAHAANGQTIVEYKKVSVNQTDYLTRFVSVDSLIKIGVGLLASLMFVVSTLAYWRERRSKFLIVMLAFMFFMLKGLVGLVDLFFPSESPLLIPFSDSFDFIILLLFAVAVLKE
jgi:hypothetical protein